MLFKTVADIHQAVWTRSASVVRLYNQFYFSEPNELDQVMGTLCKHVTWMEEFISGSGAEPHETDWSLLVMSFYYMYMFLFSGLQCKTDSHPG